MVLLCVALSLLAVWQNTANDREQTLQRARALEALGRKIFFDPSLSASGKMSCATCHDPAFAYGPPNALAVQLGGADGRQPGMRAAPSLRYLQAVPQFTEHGFDEETGDDSIDNGPTGGLTWDGRVDRSRQQARIPLLSPYEMANQNEASVVVSAQRASYASDLNLLSGSGNTQTIFRTILEALEAWQQNNREFYPYDSKYDAWLAGRAHLSENELRGLKIFSDPDKGNCAGCHPASRSANGAPPQFTDYGIVALGVRRNPAIPANSDPHWYDLGLCGPERIDLSRHQEYCGRFMTPSLRNVATRRAFFHNGVVHSLRDAVAFYIDRDKDPDRFDDLPAAYRPNVEMDSPFGPTPDGVPRLSEEDINDVVAFLRTLTDGYRDTP